MSDNEPPNQTAQKEPIKPDRNLNSRRQHLLQRGTRGVAYGETDLPGGKAVHR